MVQEQPGASFQKCLPLPPFCEPEGGGGKKERKGNSICKGPLDTRAVVSTSPDTCIYLKVGLIISSLHLRKQSQRG